MATPSRDLIFGGFRSTVKLSSTRGEKGAGWCRIGKRNLVHDEQPGTGTNKVEALCLGLKQDLVQDSRGRHFTNEEFSQLQRLRFLRVGYRDLDGDFQRFLPNLRWLLWRRWAASLRVGYRDIGGDFQLLLPNLRWLHWCGWSGNFALKNFHLKNLVILDLSYSDITYDWEAWSQIKMAKKLKVLDLTHCNCLTSTPDFSTISTLEILILKECRKLVQIDPSFGNLIKLKVLDISDSGITRLPDAIKRLSSLRILR
ncbi:hypothetical protein L1049_021194 [Liquidambar formosana]|uniref:Uncharacterized protein n=1 Tax=Liquidambar formosana TaxID=63359 RepID=A0AAP0S9G0_LIQFO